MTEPGGLGLYVHWPFCQSKCPYCDFNSHVRADVDQARWREALLSELDHFAARTAGRTVTSIFFGGGTPSLMPPETAAAVIERAAERWRVDPDLEITLEANPTSVEAARFAGYRAAGVNRVSLGVQALDDAALAFLGRRHSVEEALAALALARRHFRRLSIDLIYARPGQRLEDWRAELGRAIDLGTEHLSLYQLTIEPNTAFHGALRRGELDLPEPGLAADLYDATQETTEAAGLPAYEISNHARPGAASRHNLTYWRYDDYVGIGPGAHGRITRPGGKAATRQHRAPEAWLEMTERDGHATRQDEALTGRERLEELVMMGLRLARGIDRADFSRELGAEPEACLDRARLDRLAEAGYLTLDERGLRATPEGLRRLNAVTGFLLARDAAS